jgi:hypothetical protein
MMESFDESGEPGRDDLPFSQGLRFATLDTYLAHLKRRGATDVPWYYEVSPGIYELVSRVNRRGTPKRFTRAELAARFGFPD